MAARMQAILARDVANLGHVGDLVKVAPGYLRNYLLPKRLAMPVSKKRLDQLEHQKKLIAHQLQKLKASSMEVRDRIEARKYNIEVKVGDQGKLFGSVTTRDIENVLKENSFEINHRDIKLESPLKSIGLHEVPVRLEGNVEAKIKVVLVAKEEEKAVEAKDEDAVEQNESNAAEEASEMPLTQDQKTED